MRSVSEFMALGYAHAVLSFLRVSHRYDDLEEMHAEAIAEALRPAVTK
jgi:hypothetical protein